MSREEDRITLLEKRVEALECAFLMPSSITARLEEANATQDEHKVQPRKPMYPHTVVEY